MTSTNHALSQWFSQGDRALELVLQHCQFQSSHKTGHLAIYCPAKLFDALQLQISALDWNSSRALVKSLDLFSVADGESTHECSLLATNTPRAILEQGIDVIGLQLLLKLGVDFGRDIAIVEMGSNRGVFCSTGVLKQSAAKDLNAWIDQDMAKYHYKEGLATLEAAYASGMATQVEWVAKTFDLQPLRIAANVYAGEIQGVPVRVTENLHWQVIG